MNHIAQNANVTMVPVRLEEAEHSEDLKNKIAERAYKIFERRGRVDGHDIDDWLRAESEVLWEVH